MTRLKLVLFGAPEIILDDQPIHIARRKAIAMLIYLVVSGKPQSRDTLGAMFWPESADSRKQVRVALSALRAALGPEWFTEYSEVVRVAQREMIWADVLAFKFNYKASMASSPVDISRLEEAIYLIRGDFLAGFTLRDCPKFDSWAQIEEHELDHLTAQVLQRLVEHHTATRNFQKAIQFAERLIARDDLNEMAYQLLMRLQLNRRQPHEVVRVYERCAGTLEKELGVSPSPDTKAIYRQALTQHGRNGHTTERVTAVDDTVPYFQHTFFGRDEELSIALSKLDDPHCRLISLVGIGGIGKTHLASRIFEHFAFERQFAHTFLSLEGVTDAEQAALMLAAKLQHQLIPGINPLEQIITSLKDQPVLIVLDNVEQLVPQINPIISQLMSGTNHLKILVTSRIMLRLHEEHVIRLNGLDRPAKNAALSVDDLLAYDSVRFFLHWAQRRNPAFQLTDQNADAVAELCRINEGVPLAIRLSAVWCELLSVEDLLREIRQNVNILESSLSDIPEKHRSMRALFESIWAQLTPQEQTAFVRLSIFRGGFTREAAEQVTGITSFLLKSLLDKSLLVVDQGVDRRYHIHEMLRLFASQMGAPLTSDGTLVERYIRYYTNFISLRESDMKGSHQMRAIHEIDGEFYNIQQAWMSAVETRQINALSEMINGLFAYLRIRGYWNEGRNLFQDARRKLQADDISDAATRHLINRLSMRYYHDDEGDLTRFLHLLLDAEAQDDSHEVAYIVTVLGWQSRGFGYHRLSLRYFHIALNLHRQLNDHYSAAEMIRAIALAHAALGDLTEAERLNQVSMQMRQQFDSHFDLIINDVLQSELRMLKGDMQQAIDYMLEAYNFNVEYIGNMHAHMHTKFLAWCYLFAGDLAQAEYFAEGVVRVTKTPGLEGDFVIGLLALAVLAALKGDHDESDRLLQQCEQILTRGDLTTDIIYYTTSVWLLTGMMVALTLCLNRHIERGRAHIASLTSQNTIMTRPFIAHTVFTAEVLCLYHERGETLNPDLLEWLQEQPWLSGYLTHVVHSQG